MPRKLIELDGWDDATPDPRLLVVNGPRFYITTREGTRNSGGQLLIRTGERDTPDQMIPLVPRKYDRLFIQSGHGDLTGAAVRWLDDAGIKWAWVTDYGPRPRLLGMSAGYYDAKTLRQQAMVGEGCPDHERGLVILRTLIAQKLSGQAINAENMLGDKVAAKGIRECIADLTTKTDVLGIRACEGEGAALYWAAWEGVPVKWSYPRPTKLHWQQFNSRKTLVHDWETNKDATDPINACLNFGYFIAEHLCTMALIAAGLDPTMGIGHSDRKNRDSFSLDLIEPFRPWVDQVVYEIFRKPQAKKDYAETMKNGKPGVVRLSENLRKEISRGVCAYKSRLNPSVKMIVTELAKVPVGTRETPLPKLPRKPVASKPKKKPPVVKPRFKQEPLPPVQSYSSVLRAARQAW